MHRRTRLTLALATAVLGASSLLPAQAQVRIGLMAPLTGPLGITGQEVKRGFDLALEHLGGKLGGQEVVVTTANDQANPTTAVSEFSRLVEREHISILMGLAASNVAMAVAPAAAKANVTVLMTHAGPDVLAGKGCQENVFSLGHQNEQFAYAMGSYLKQQGLNKVYFMGLDFQAGWEMLEALQQGLGQPVAGKSLTAMNQVDFAPELAKARDAKPDAIFAFYPGSAAVAFVRQYNGAGLKKQVPLFGVGAMVDSMVIKAQGDAALGVTTANTWNASVKNAQNERFTADFKAKNEGREPTTFSAQTYDAVMYLDAALKQTKGSTDAKALRSALRSNPGFKSIRSSFALNTNQFPIQDLVIQRVEKDDQGKLVQKIVSTVPQVKDRFAAECSLK